MTVRSPRARQLAAQARSFLIISLVTVLIWLLAEAESLRTLPVRTEVAFRPEPDSLRTIRAEPDFPGSVTIRLEGSTGRINEVAETLRKPIRLHPGMEAIPIEPGTWTIDLRNVLRNLPVVRESGASIAGVDPPVARVTIENLVNLEVKVRVDPPPGVLMDPPEAVPQVVELRLPERLAPLVTSEFQVAAALDPAQVAPLDPGRRMISGVRLELPEALRNVEGVRLRPSAVNVVVTIRSRTTQWVIPSVPVHFRVAPTETDNWVISMPEESRVLKDVRVTGPSDYVERIKSGEVKPIAFIPLSFEDLERAAGSGDPLLVEPTFTQLPTSLRFEVDESQRRVRVSVRPRETATPGGTPPPPGTRSGP